MPRIGSLRPFTRAALAAGACGAVFALWLLLDVGGERATLVFDDVTLSVVTLGMAVPCWRAAARAATARRARLAWALLGASVASWGLGETVWTWFEVGRGIAVPFPSLADVGYIGCYPLAMVAILLLPGERAAISRIRVALDGALIAASILFLSWMVAMGEVLTGSGSVGDLLGVGYLLADVALLSIVLTNLLATSRPRRSDVLLATGLTALCVADTAFAYLTATDTYSTGALSDIGWLAGFLLIGLAAVSSRFEDGSPRAARSPERRWALLLPALPAVIVAALAPTVDDRVPLALAGSVFVLVVLRQAVIHRENEVLAASLRAQVEQVRNREERFAYAAKATSDAIWDYDLSTHQIAWGDGLLTQFGHPLDGAGSIQWWTEHVHPHDRARVGESLDAVLEQGETSWTSEYRFAKADGTYASVIDRGYVVHDASGAAVRMVGAMTDITERHRYEAELSYRAHHDALTGLPNRVRLTSELEGALRPREQDGPDSVGVLFVDIDHFKLINDSYGHAAGDDVIQVLAGRLRNAVRPDDVVCRFGGDEFVVLCPRLGTMDDASKVASRILEVLDDPVHVQGRTLHVSVSIGIAVDRPGAVSVDDLLSQADTALYEAKAKGRARFDVFTDGLRGRAAAHIDRLSDLRRALDSRALEVHYQPIVDLTTGETVGAEALLRWERDGEQVPPPEFIALAEDSGLIVPLGIWVIEQACRDAAAWPEGWWVSVNVSTRQVSEELVDVVVAALDAAQLTPDRLCLEVTETASLEPTHVRAVLERLHALGIRIAIDDFGTGHSSLSHLRELPVGAVKIDRAFVGGMTSRSSDQGIVAAVIALARGLDVRVIAEGVEREEQAAALRQLGCEHAQGYLFARPMPAAAFLLAATGGAEVPVAP